MTKHTVTFQVLTDDKCELVGKLEQFLWEMVGDHSQPVRSSLVIDGVCTAPCCEVPPEEDDGRGDLDYNDEYAANGVSRDDFF